MTLSADGNSISTQYSVNELSDSERHARARQLTAELDQRHAGANGTISAAAKDRIVNAVRDTGYGTRRFILDMTKPDGWLQQLPELLSYGLVTKGRSLDWAAPVWVLTDVAMYVRTELLDNRVMRHLVDLVRAEDLDGEDLADIAAYLDEDATCEGHDDTAALQAGHLDAPALYCNGSCVDYVGPGEGFLQLLRHVARWSGESGADLRQEIEHRLG